MHLFNTTTKHDNNIYNLTTLVLDIKADHMLFMSSDETRVSRQEVASCEAPARVIGPSWRWRT